MCQLYRKNQNQNAIIFNLLITVCNQNTCDSYVYWPNYMMFIKLCRFRFRSVHFAVFWLHQALIDIDHKLPGLPEEY